MSTVGTSMRSLATFVAVMGYAVQAQNVVIFRDTEPSDADWEIIAEGETGGSTHSVGQDYTDGLGNPSPYRRMTHTLPGTGGGPNSTLNIRPYTSRR